MKFTKRCSVCLVLQVSILSMTMFAALSAGAQSMGISSTAITPDASSILEMRTTTKGLLIPRLTTTERNNISSPATGLMVYNTTTNAFNFYNGSGWTALATGSAGVNSVTGTSNRITIGGTASDPTIDISSSYVGQSSITTLGTISTGTWNGSIITSGYGGTGNGFTKFIGPTTSEKTFTLPNANATILTDNATITAAQGGTGNASYTIGDILYASASTTLSKLAGVATGSALISGGVGTAPSWGKIGLTTHVSGVLPIANGGTNSTATPTDGGVVYGDGTSYQVTAAGTTGQVLKSNGAAAPTWVYSGAMMFAGQSNNTAVNNTTLYFPILGGQAGNATDAQAGTRSLMSRAGTIRNLYVELSAALAAGKTGTVTVMKNGVATSVLTTLSVGPTAFNDLVNSVTVAAGDEIGIKVTTTGNVKFSWSAEFHF